MGVRHIMCKVMPCGHADRINECKRSLLRPFRAAMCMGAYGGVRQDAWAHCDLRHSSYIDARIQQNMRSPDNAIETAQYI